MTLDPDLNEWLIGNSDPSVRLRVLTELLDRPTDDPAVVDARQRIGREGWAASILASQLPDGQLTAPSREGEDLYRPTYVTTNWQLIVLAELGADRSDPRLARSAEFFLDQWREELGGVNSHLCYTGNAARMLYRLGYGEDPRVRRAIDWLVSDQKADGGWDCFSSDSGNLDSWEALGAFAAIPKSARSAAIERAVERGAEFYLERRLMQEGPRYEPWFRLHYPVHYYYDLLVGLDLLTSLGYGDDPRLLPALEWLESRRRPNGRWPLDTLHPDVANAEDPALDLPERSPYGIRGIQSPFFSFGLELPGQSSRWVTTTALRVLRRSGRG